MELMWRGSSFGKAVTRTTDERPHTEPGPVSTLTPAIP
jgi:hypothetical protein